MDEQGEGTFDMTNVTESFTGSKRSYAAVVTSGRTRVVFTETAARETD